MTDIKKRKRYSKQKRHPDTVKSQNDRDEDKDVPNDDDVSDLIVQPIDAPKGKDI
ncbi:MAG: hypothetical protein J1G01_03650 [Clostridiales bacterium]|nr:hypothetical protein [Clostridiales bacterium]